MLSNLAICANIDRVTIKVNWIIKDGSSDQNTEPSTECWRYQSTINVVGSPNYNNTSIAQNCGYSLYSVNLDSINSVTQSNLSEDFTEIDKKVELIGNIYYVTFTLFLIL